MAAASSSSSSSPPSGIDLTGFLIPNPAPERGKAVRIHASEDGAFFAYGAGSNVVVRSASDPTCGYVYEEHTSDVKCAAFSPDGKFVASGDAKGEVRVWSTSDASHTLRKALMGLPGGVEDVAWDTSGKLLGLGGHGKDKARITTVDSGTDMGTMQSLAKPCLAAAASRSDPSAFAFAGEAKSVGLYTGKPSRFVASLTEHSAFVNALAFSPDGSKLVSSGTDKVILVRDAATGAVLSSTKAAHKGSVYNVCFSPDGTQLATSSADKTIKVWSVAEDGSLAQKGQVVVGKAITDMQNGLVWVGPSTLVSASLSGAINISSPTSAAPDRVIEGPAGVVTTMCHSDGLFVTGDRGGSVCIWERRDGGAGFEATRVAGDGHPKTVSCCDIREGAFVTGGFDDKLRFGSVADKAFSGSAAVGAQPKDVTLVPGNAGVAVVATSRFVKSFDTASGSELSSVPAPWEGKAIAASPDGSTVFVGGGDGIVYSFGVGASGELTEGPKTATATKAAVASLAVSPDGAHLAVGDAAKELCVVATDTLEFVVKGKWTAHTSRIAAVAWNAAGTALASTGVDRHVFVWNLSESYPVLRLNLAVAQPAHSIAWEEGDAAVWVSTSGGVTRRIAVSV